MLISKHQVNYVIEQFEEHLKSEELRAKMPEFIVLRSLEDSTAICELKLFDSGKV